MKAAERSTDLMDMLKIAMANRKDAASRLAARGIEGADLSNLVAALREAIVSIGGVQKQKRDLDAAGLEKLVAALRAAVAKTESAAAGMQKRDVDDTANTDGEKFTIGELWGIFQALKEKGMVGS